MRPIVLLAAVLCCLAAAARADGPTIAVFTKDLTNPFYEAFRNGAEMAVKGAGGRAVQYAPNRPDNIAEQMNQVENAIAAHPDAMILVPVDVKALAPAINKVNAARIPLVNAAERAPAGEFVSYVGSDDFAMARDTATLLLKAIGGRGKVIILEGNRGSETNRQRMDGFREALKAYPDVALLAAQPANYQRLQALQVTENLLQAFAQVDGILAANDSMALGAIEALAGAKRKAAVIGINATPEGIGAIKQGSLLASGDFDGFKMGCVAAMAVLRHLQGQVVPKTVALPVTVVDKSNYQPWDRPAGDRTCPAWAEIVK